MLFGSTLSKGTLTVIIIVGILAIAAIIATVFYNKRKK